MIYTKVNSKQEIRTILSALVAMGYSIHGDDTTPDEFNREYDGVAVLKLGDYVAGLYSLGDENYIPQGEFLLRAAQMKFGAQPSIKLNDSYTAVVSKEGTTVGCQTFDNAKILEVAEAIKRLDK